MVRRVGTLLLLALSACAAAQCSIPPDADRLSFEGFATAYFENLKADSARDALEISGDVCVAGIGWTLLTERLTLSGLSTTLALHAPAPELRVPRFVVVGAELTASRTELRVRDVSLSGADLTGTASELILDLTDNTLTLTAPSLQGSALLVVGDRATLRGERLTVDNAVATTCVCSDTPLYTVRGSRVDIDLTSERFTLQGASVHVGPLVVPLREGLELGPEDFDDLALPFAITLDPDAPGDPGEGLGFELSRLELAPGISASADLAGLDGAHPLTGSALLRGRRRGLQFEIGMIDGGVSSEIVAVHPLTDWLDAEFALRNFDRDEVDFLHEGVLALTAAVPLPLPARFGALAGDARLFAAASSQSPEAGPVAGARLGVRIGADYEPPATPVGSFAVAMRAHATLYPDLAARQLALRLAPSWRLDAGPLALTVGFVQVWSDAGSPFSVRLDRLEPSSLLTADLALRAEPAERLALTGHLAVAYDLLGGWERLRGDVAVEFAPAPRDRVELGVEADLRGLLVEGEVAWFETGIGWTRRLGRGRAELAMRLRTSLAPDPPELAWLDLAVAYPLVGPEAVLTPFLAFDVAPLLAGGSPLLSGHGLDLVWRSCCGTLLLGYRAGREGFSTRLGVRFDGGEPSGTIPPVAGTP